MGRRGWHVCAQEQGGGAVGVAVAHDEGVRVRVCVLQRRTLERMKRCVLCMAVAAQQLQVPTQDAKMTLERFSHGCDPHKPCVLQIHGAKKRL